MAPPNRGGHSRQSRLAPAPPCQRRPARNLLAPFRAQLRSSFPGELRGSGIFLVRSPLRHAPNSTATLDTLASPALDSMLAQAYDVATRVTIGRSSRFPGAAPPAGRDVDRGWRDGTLRSSALS